MSGQAPGRKQRRPRWQFVVGSDLPKLTGIAPWERELLAPIVEHLVDEALANRDQREQTRSDGAHAEDQDEEP
jgi:hypothetical protein